MDLEKGFEAIDREGKGKIGKEELIQFMNERYYFPNEKEIGYLMGKFDQEKMGNITFEQFI